MVPCVLRCKQITEHTQLQLISVIRGSNDLLFKKFDPHWGLEWLAVFQYLKWAHCSHQHSFGIICQIGFPPMCYSTWSVNWMCTVACCNSWRNCHPKHSQTFNCHPKHSQTFNCHPKYSQTFNCHPKYSQTFNCHPKYSQTFNCYFSKDSSHSIPDFAEVSKYFCFLLL
jgi:hypothetical protein